MSKKKYKHYFHAPKKSYTFTLGKYYLINNTTLCQFIKTTPKGCNLLNVKTFKCILTSSVYDIKYTQREVPHNVVTFKVSIPDWFESVKEAEAPTQQCQIEGCENKSEIHVCSEHIYEF